MAVSTYPVDQPLVLTATPAITLAASAAAGKVLTSDASGNAAWAAVAAAAFLTPTAAVATHTSAANELTTVASGTFTDTSPAQSAGRIFGVSNTGTGVVTVTAASGVFRGPGLLAAGLASITLGRPGSGALFVSDGTDWWIIGGGQQTAWTAPTGLTNSWVDNGGSTALGYMKDEAGIVHLRGAIKSGTNNLAAFTLPAGFRPGQNINAAVWQLTANTLAIIQITSAGVISPFGTSATTNPISWDGVTFLAEN